MGHLAIAIALLGVHLMNVELDAADAAMRADPVPSTQAALDARATVCDRKSACDLFGCDPECDTLIGDAAPPSTTLKVCRGDLPSLSVLGNADVGCLTYEVGSTDAAHPDLLSHDDADTFRHVYRVSGDPACVGTGKPLGSGRDCTVDSAPEGQCAYIAQGYGVYAVTGGSCSQHGVGLCSGPFCI